MAAPVPDVVLSLTDGDQTRLTWENEVGGLTYEVGSGDTRRFVKWAPAGSGIDLTAEAARMRWARPFHPVPEVLGTGKDPGGTWLVTAALPGTRASGRRWRADPATAVVAIGEGLRALHDALPAADCPFSWASDVRLADARAKVAGGRMRTDLWHSCHQALGVVRALEQAADIPPDDQRVVCHGDTCPPNTMLGPDGRWSGHVDLGLLGVADRWADIAVATWSTQWNYGPGWEGLLLDAYGIAPDPDRTRYYRLLWDLSS
jgi:kanamycin kinase